MVRLSVILSTTLVSISLAAQPLRVAVPQPISVTRIGVSPGRFTNPIVASNGASFLMSWMDDRFIVPWLRSNQSAPGLLTRVDADGAALDEFPIALPFIPISIVWTGSEWVAAGSGSLARISPEGKILALRRISADDFRLSGVAWAGNRLVAVGTTFRRDPTRFVANGLRSLTLDAELNVEAAEQLTDLPAAIVGIAGDGQSAIAVWREEREYTPDTALHVVSFGRDGLMQGSRMDILSSGQKLYPDSDEVLIGATGLGYVVLYPGKSQIRFAGLWLERDLRSRPIPLNLEMVGAVGTLAWDGNYLTLYSTDFENRLLASRFTKDGFLISSPLEIGILSSRWFELAAACIEGRTILAYVNVPQPTELKFRVFTLPAFSEASERSPVGASGLPQDVPVAVSGVSQSLVAWRERTSATQWAVHATRLDGNATVLDPESLLLSTSSCDRAKPAVATNGQDFLAAWYDAEGIAVASIRADGAFTKRPSIRLRYGPSCSESRLKLVSNGADYLLLWAEQPLQSTDEWDLVGLRLRPDGSIVDHVTLGVAKLNAAYPAALSFYAASNGQDYLIAWGGTAIRMTSEGTFLDTSRKILLGKGEVRQLWWNGKTYIAETVSSEPFGQTDYRFLRIGSDGSGGRSPFGPQIDSVQFPPGPGGFLYIDVPACDVAGCSIGGTTRHTDGSNTLTLVRFEDDGTKVTIRRQEVVNLSYPSVNDGVPVPATFVNAARPAFVYLQQQMEQPFSGVHRLMIAPFALPRGRAVGHP